MEPIVPVEIEGVPAGAFRHDPPVEPITLPAGPVRLRPWREDDVDAVLAALLDPDTRLGAMESKDDPALVARQGFQGLMKGEASVFAGSLASKAMGRLSAVTPGPVAAKLNRQMTEPGSAES